MGNFGTQSCFGLVLLEKNNNIISMEIYCEAQNQDDDKYYTKVTRDSSLDAGVSEYVLIDGSGKWKNMVNSKCKYAIKYKKNALFVNSKCRQSSLKILFFALTPKSLKVISNKSRLYFCL